MSFTRNLILIMAIYFVSASLVFASQATPLSIRSSAEIENSCRAKSKEVALETYRGCVTDTKTAQIEQVRRQYKVKLLALKAYYENELKKMNGSAAKASAPAQAAAAPAAPAQPAVVTAKAQEEMKVQLKSAPQESETDESAPNMPEPIPVESK